MAKLLKLELIDEMLHLLILILFRIYETDDSIMRQLSSSWLVASSRSSFLKDSFKRFRDLQLEHSEEIRISIKPYQRSEYLFKEERPIFRHVLCSIISAVVTKAFSILHSNLITNWDFTINCNYLFHTSRIRKPDRWSP